MTIKVITDSAADLPLTFVKEQNIALIPLRVHLDGQDYDDLITIQPETVYQAMREGKAPITSQGSPQFMIELFSEFAEAKQPAIYIACSSELSGTYQTAVMMREEAKQQYPDLVLEIIDTKCISMGQGLIVQEVAKHAAAGADLSTLVKIAQFHSEHMESLFTVDDLEYLARGGRVSRASAFIGGLLNIKPLLNVEDGKLIPIEKLRGHKKLVRATLDLMEARGDRLAEQTIGISHGDDYTAALEWKAAMEERFGTTSFFISTVGAAVGSHSGPGTIAIFFLNKLPIS